MTCAFSPCCLEGLCTLSCGVVVGRRGAVKAINKGAGQPLDAFGLVGLHLTCGKLTIELLVLLFVGCRSALLHP